MWVWPLRPCNLPGQPLALPNPYQLPEEEGASFHLFRSLIKFCIRPDLSPGPSWSLRNQGGWYQKAQGAAWLRQRPVAWKVVTGLLPGLRALFSWVLAVLWAETSHEGYETLPTVKGSRVPCGEQE